MILDVYGRDDLTDIPSLIDQTKYVEARYLGITLKGAMIKGETLTHSDRRKYNVKEDEWFNFVMTGVYEQKKQETYFEKVVERDEFIIFEAYLESGEFSEVMEDLNKSSPYMEISGQEVFFEPCGLETQFRTSDHEGTDHFEKDVPAVFYRINGEGSYPVSEGNKIDERTQPSPYGLEREDPPYLNFIDACNSHLDMDIQEDLIGNILLFFPNYEHHIEDYDLNRVDKKIDIELDYGEDLNGSDFSLKLLSDPDDAGTMVRKTFDVDSDRISAELEEIPDVFYIYLLCKGDIVDCRKVSVTDAASPYLKESEKMMNTHPRIAAASAKIGLKNGLIDICESKDITFREDDDISDLVSRLIEEDIIKDREKRVMIDNWYEKLTGAVCLKDIDEEEVRRIIDGLSRFLDEKLS